MPNLPAYEVTERLQQVLLLLGQSLTPAEIAVKLRVSKEQIYKDIKSIKKAGLKFLTKLGNQELAYYYQVWLSNRFHVNKELWELTRNPDISDRDKISAYKTIIDNDNSARDTLKEGINLFTVEELKNKLKELESLNNKDNNNKSYMTVKLPSNSNQDINPILKQLDNNSTYTDNHETNTTLD